MTNPALEEIADAMSKALPTAQTFFDTMNPSVSVTLGTETFRYTEGGSSLPGRMEWSSKCMVGSLGASRISGIEYIEDMDDFGVWISDTCDRLETQAQKALVRLFLSPQSLIPTTDLRVALYYLHLTESLDANARVTDKTLAALPEWNGWAKASDGASVLPLTSFDGLSTGALVARHTGIYQCGFKIYLHSCSPLLESVTLESKSSGFFATPVTLEADCYVEHMKKQARELFVKALISHVARFSNCEQLWGVPTGAVQVNRP